jgi:hypothetical protein
MSDRDPAAYPCGCVPCEPLAACPEHDNTKFAPSPASTPDSLPRCRCGAVEMRSGWARYDGHTAEWAEESYPGCAAAPAKEGTP